MSEDRSSSLRLVTPPTTEPVSLAQAKQFLRIEHTADDDAVLRAMFAARLAAEHYTKQALLPQTWDYTIANPCPTKIELPFGPAQSITSITLTNEAGASSTMNIANFRLTVDGFAVLFDPAVSIEKLTVRYVAGLATSAAELPVTLVQGILHHIAVMVEQRDGAAAMPMQAMAYYQPYRRVRL